jgi:uncharacterized membrane protein YqiK
MSDVAISGWAWTMVEVIVALVVIYWVAGVRIIRSDQIAVVEKWWSPHGSLKESIIALAGEAGFQPEVLRGGIHFRTPLMFKVHVLPLVTIGQGKIGYVFARDGIPLKPEQTLARVIPDNTFSDVKSFIDNGGQRGPQRQILREGTYAFNLAQFVIITEEAIYYLPLKNPQEDATINSMWQHLNEMGGFVPVIIKGSEDRLGIVTVHDGPSMPLGDIIAPPVGDKPKDPNYHNNFQDPEKFLAAGGFRGRQYQVLIEGTYFVNRLFATVELIDKTVIPIGFAGVVVSYYGPKGEDVSGEEYRHGELVATGERGVWQDPLMPGKYAFNTFAGKVMLVPTTNIILKWIRNETGAHQYDENLTEVGLITKDAFEPLLPLSIVIHIDYKKAPLVIQRFGDIKLLVEQTLDPMVSSYFKNIGQTRTLIQLIQERNEIQALSSTEMKERFDRYNLELEEVLIGTPRAPEGDQRIETILTQLRDRQIALEKLETFEKQKQAAQKERELNEANAVALQQTALTQSNINISIQENQGKADLQRATQDAQKVKVMADAEATRIKRVAEADADREARVGIGKAIAIEEQVKAYGMPGLQVAQDVGTKIASAIEVSKMPIVPETVVNMGGGGDGGGGAASFAGSNAFGLLMALLTMEKLGAPVVGGGPKEKAPAQDESQAAVAEKIKGELRDAVRGDRTNGGQGEKSAGA